MKDKSLVIWLILIFGISGIAVITAAWLWPTLETDRLTATAAGSIGVFVATAQALRLRQSPATNNEQSRLKVEITDNS